MNLKFNGDKLIMLLPYHLFFSYLCSVQTTNH